MKAEDFFVSRQKNKIQKKILENIKNISFTKIEDYPFVSIIFPNWNGKNDTIECLTSLAKLDYPKSKMEIIITDNGSEDGSLEAIEKKFSEIENEGWYKLKLIENKENRGAPAAYNQCLKEINKDYNYAWKLDNDVILNPKSLIGLIKVGESMEKIGIIGGNELSYHEKNKVRTIGTLFSSLTKEYHPYVGKDYNKISYQYYNVDVTPGTSTLIKKAVIEKIGNFNEIYFVYYDDVDFCWRSKKEGFKIVGVKKSLIWHKKGGTTGDTISSFGLYYYLRNRLIFFRLNTKGINKIISILKLVFIAYFRHYLRAFYHLKFKACGIIIKGIFSGLLTKIKK
ncbi:MAG: glycosyltransferase family 2 protein [Candidatus Thorarchaeota archaeon]